MVRLLHSSSRNAALLLDGEHRRLDAGAQVELGEDVAHVQLDGVVADVERPADGLVGQPPGQVVENFALARGELL